MLVLVAVILSGINILRGGIFPWLSIPCYGALALTAFLSALPTLRPMIARSVMTSLIASAVFCAYVLIRILFSPDNYLAQTDLLLVFGASIVYLLVGLHLPSPNLRATLVAVLILLAVSNCVVGAIQLTEGQDFMPFKELPRTAYGTRISGFLGSPNHLAGLLEVVALLGLAMTFWSRWKIWAKVLLGYGSLVSLAGIVFTGSRGGYISIAAGLLVFGVLSLLIVTRHRFDRLGYVLGTVGVATLIIGGIAYLSVSQTPAFRSRVESVATLDDARMRIWPSAVKQFQLCPVFGTGSGTFLYYGREFRDPLLQTDPKYAHNDYLQFLAEYGIVGMTAFLVFLVIHLLSGWKGFNRILESRNEFEGVGDTSMALTVGALSATAAIMAHSVVDFNLHIPSNTLLLAFVFGILAHPGGAGPAWRSEPIFPAPLALRLVLPVLGLWIAFVGLPKLPGEYFAWKAREALGDWTTLDTGEYAVRAEDFARRGLHTDPKNPDLLNSLGDALFARANLSSDSIERERLINESIDAYQRALQLAPQDRNYVLALGWSLDALNRFEESEAVFKRAVALDPNSGNVRWAYAAHLHQRGKLDEAEAEYQRAYALGSGQAHDGLQRLKEDRKARQTDPTSPANQ